MNEEPVAPGLADFLRDLLFLPEPASRMAREVDELHFFVIATTMAGAAGVFLLGTLFLIRYRRRATTETTPRIIMPLRYEFPIWGGLLGLFVLWWIIGFVVFVDMQEPPEDTIDVYVTGKQWMWKFAHPEGRESVGYLVVPEGSPVKLIITSRDVIHSLFIPALRIKQDALPGRFTTIWFQADRTGIFPIYCAEFCGLSHSKMWATLVVVTPEDFADWLAGEIPEPVARAGGTADMVGGHIGAEEAVTLADRGRDLAAHYGCLSCHTLDGQPYIGPTWWDLYGRREELADGRIVVVDEAYITQSMMRPDQDVVAGFAPVMPSYKGLIPQADVAAIVEFIKSLRPIEREPAPYPPLPAERIELGEAP